MFENGQITYLGRYPASYTPQLYAAGACRLDSDHVIVVGGSDHTGGGYLELALFAIHQISDDTWDKRTGIYMSHRTVCLFRIGFISPRSEHTEQLLSRQIQLIFFSYASTVLPDFKNVGCTYMYVLYVFSSYTYVPDTGRSGQVRPRVTLSINSP